MKDNTLIFLGVGAVALYLYTKNKSTTTVKPGTLPVTMVPAGTTASSLASSSLLLPALAKLVPSLSSLFTTATPAAADVAANNSMLNQQLVDDNFSTDPISIAPSTSTNILYAPISNPISSAPFGAGSGSSSPIVDTSSSSFLDATNAEYL